MNLEKTMKRILLLLLLCVHTMWPAVETCAAEIAERYPLCTEHPVRKVRLPELPDSLDAAGAELDFETFTKQPAITKA